MKKLSRILVSFLMVLSAQSSLGTKAAQINHQTLGQNGYRKYEDGLLVQWGYSAIAGASRTIYLNISFYDTNYNVITNVFKSQGATSSVVSAAILSKSKSNFIANGTYQYANGDSGYLQTTESIYWVAIGRWK